MPCITYCFKFKFSLKAWNMVKRKLIHCFPKYLQHFVKSNLRVNWLLMLWGTCSYQLLFVNRIIVRSQRVLSSIFLQSSWCKVSMRISSLLNLNFWYSLHMLFFTFWVNSFGWAIIYKESWYFLLFPICSGWLWGDY